MAQILVRNLDDSLKESLRRAAAAHGHSMEEEARRILQNALSQPAFPNSAETHSGLGTKIHNLFKDIDVPDEFFEALDEIRHGSDVIDVRPRYVDFDE